MSTLTSYARDRKTRDAFYGRQIPRPITSRTIGQGLCSPLPTIYGQGLTTEEQVRVAECRDRARAAYRYDVPSAWPDELEEVARRAAGDALRRVLADRPAASAPAVAKPVSPRRPLGPTLEDLAWWAANSPTRDERYNVVTPRQTPAKDEAEHGDFPARRAGVDRGPMKRRPSNGQTGITDFDVHNHVGAVG